jgi:hypothetical protein
MSRIVARTAGAALVLALATSAQASPKGYDVDRLLRQGAPEWLHAPASAPAPQQAPPAYAPQPLDRIPRMPAPALLPKDNALTVPPPLPETHQAMPPAMPTQRQIIRAPGSPRSTVSGAWSPRR